MTNGYGGLRLTQGRYPFVNHDRDKNRPLSGVGVSWVIGLS